MSTNKRKHPKGYWMAVGIGVGVAIGVAMGPIFENIGVGIAIGVAIGSGLGASLERKNRDDIRPLTEQERKRRKWVAAIGITLVGILVLALIIAYFLMGR
jgi:drug/metabolite transporter (DMT)-like permease